MLVEKETPIDELLEKYPESNRWLLERHIHCTQCGEPVWGSIGERIESRGLEVEKVLKELNAFLEKQGYSE